MEYVGDGFEAIRPIIADLSDGNITAAEAGARVEGLMPGSTVSCFLRSMGAVEDLKEGATSLEEAERVVFGNADLHPIMAELFLYCALVSAHGESIEEPMGYWVLASGKSMLHDVTDQFEGAMEAGPISSETREKVADHPALSTVGPYMEKARDHLIKHMLVHEVDSEDEFLDPDTVEQIMERADDVAPVFANLARDIVVADDFEREWSWILMARLLGELKLVGAVDAMADGLDMLIDEHIHEAVLTLVKLAEAFPGLVAERMREIAVDPDRADGRLAAVEVLGWRWREQGNLEFLYGMLRRLEPDDPDFDDLFKFLTQSLILTGLREAAEEAAAALDQYEEVLEPDTVSATLRLMDEFEPFDDSRARDLVNEDIYDLCCGPLEQEAAVGRLTITLLREASLDEEMDGMIAEWEVDADGEPSAAWLKTGRNEPCPCGSGKKFKKCCLSKAEAADAPEPFFSEDEGPLLRLFDRLMAFSSSPGRRADRESALAEFLDAAGIDSFEEQEESGSPVPLPSVFLDWYFFGRKNERGRTVAGEFADSGPGLDPDEQEMLDASGAGRFSVFEAVEVRFDEGMKLKDIFRGDVLDVREKLATETMARWDMIGGRVGPVGDHHELLGGVFPVALECRADIEKYGKRKAKAAIESGAVEDVDEWLKTSGYLLAIYSHDRCMKIIDRPMPVIVTPEGDEMCRCEAHYRIEDLDAVRTALEQDELFEKIGPEDEQGGPGLEGMMEVYGIARGATMFEWEMSPAMEADLRAGEHMGPQMPSIAAVLSERGAEHPTSGAATAGVTDGGDELGVEDGEWKRVFGMVTISGGRLALKAMSMERLEYGKEALERLIGKSVKHLVDEIEDQVPMLEGARERGHKATAEKELGRSGGVDPEISKRIEREYLEKHYATWADTPLPALKGKTPREAARTRVGRLKVDGLLKGMENRAERAARDGRPAFDFGRIREELKIPPDL